MKITLSHAEVVEIIIDHVQQTVPEWNGETQLYAQNENYDESIWEIGVTP